MSRVDEALRRGAELHLGEVREEASATDGEAVTSDDVEALSRESFPLEMPDRRRARPVTQVFPVAPPANAAPAPAATGRVKPDSLMERIDSRLAEKVVVDGRIMPSSREQYRRLAASLHQAQNAHGVKVVLIASALSGEGKTLTASNLALTLSESYQRHVLLIDADLRRPTLHTVFGVDNSAGLSDGLDAVEEQKLPVRQVSANLAILPAGSRSGDPMAGLTSERMRLLVDEARALFEWVIIDTPPMAFLSDANLLTAMVDTTVVVVKAGSTPYDLVQRAVETIGRDRTFGVVLNRAETSAHESRYAHYHQYEYAGAAERG